jgi:hypothetical protein
MFQYKFTNLNFLTRANLQYRKTHKYRISEIVHLVPLFIILKIEIKYKVNADKFFFLYF